MALSTGASTRAHGPVDEECLLKADEYRATIATLTAALAAEKAARIKAEEKAAAAMQPTLTASLAAEKAALIKAEEKVAAAMQGLVSVKEKVGMKADTMNELVEKVNEIVVRHFGQDSTLGRFWAKKIAEIKQ